MDDAFFRWVTDLGVTGPNQGKGGKYVFVGPDYEGELPEGYRVVKTPTYRNWMFLRALVSDGDLEAATLGLQNTVPHFPPLQAGEPAQGESGQCLGQRRSTPSTPTTMATGRN